jgi:alkylation response protein AidB-like acyl-CoA dehydrogenase
MGWSRCATISLDNQPPEIRARGQSHFGVGRHSYSTVVRPQPEPSQRTGSWKNVRISITRESAGFSKSARTSGRNVASMPHPYGLDEPSTRTAAQATTLADEVLSRHAADVDRNGRFPAESTAALGAAGLLGLCVPAEHGGLAHGARCFCAVVEELGRACASTAMVFVMHTSATQTIAASPRLADRSTLLQRIASGDHLTTLALSEKGSRSHFWAPVSHLTSEGDGFVTNAFKSWVTAAHHADSFVASAQIPQAQSPLESTLYLARTEAKEIRPQVGFDGLGLRGNDSAPVAIESLFVAQRDLVSEPGKGLEMMLQVIQPWFAIGTAAMAHGLCRAALAATAHHLSATPFEHTGTALRDVPQLRARLAQMSVRTEASRALLGRALAELEAGSPEAPLFVLYTRKAALEAAVEVTDLAMKTCGGAAFSRQMPSAPIERLFRDARAGWVMAPTVDHLDDFIGKALTGLPLL